MATNTLLSLNVKPSRFGEIIAGGRQQKRENELADLQSQRAERADQRQEEALQLRKNQLQKADEANSLALTQEQKKNAKTSMIDAIVEMDVLAQNKSFGKMKQIADERTLDLLGQIETNPNVENEINLYRTISQGVASDPSTTANMLAESREVLIAQGKSEADAESSLTPTNLAKLQSERTGLESALAQAQNPEQKVLIERSIKENQDQINKSTQVTGTTEFDPAGQSAITSQQQGKDEVELREKKIGVEVFHSLVGQAQATLEANPDASTAVATVARFAVNVAAESRALARNMDIDLSAVNLNPDNFTGDFGKLADASREMKTMGLQLALALAVSAGQTNKALSDKDLARFIDQTGVEESDPRLIINNLNRLDKQGQENFIIRHKNIKPKEEFGGFIFDTEKSDTLKVGESRTVGSVTITKKSD